MPPTPRSNTPLQQLHDAVGRVRRDHFVWCVGVAATFGLLCLLLVGLLDATLRLPMSGRLLGWAAVCAAAVWCVCTLMRRPSCAVDTRVLARQAELARPALRGWLLSAVDLEHTQSAAAQSCVQGASERLQAGGPLKTARGRSLLAAFGGMLFAGVLVWAGWFGTPMTALATQRVLLPMAEAPWPARTAVASTMPDTMVHGREVPLQLQADNLTVGDAAGPLRAALTMTHNTGASTQWVDLRHQQGVRHEAVVTLPPTTTEVDVVFHAKDAVAAGPRIDVRPLPGLIGATLMVTPPWTHTNVLDVQEWTNNDGRLPTLDSPVLAGSTARLEMRFNRPLIAPRLDRAWLIHHLTWPHDDLPRVTGDGSGWAVEWLVDAPTILSIGLEDEAGLRALERLRLVMRVREDHRPTVTLTMPAVDQRVPPSAVLTLAATAEDDHPLRSVGFDARLRDSGTQVWQSSHQVTAGRRTVAYKQTAPLHSMGVEIGAVIELRAFADDLGDPSSGDRRTWSTTTLVQVVDEAIWAHDLQEVLAGIADRAGQLADAQEDLMIAPDADWTGSNHRDQRRLAADVSRAGDRVQHVLETLESGGGTQPRLHEQVDNAQLALEAAQEKARFNTLDPAQRLEQQQAVVDLLQSLADELRQDEARWAAQEVLRALWDEQQALQQRTATLPHSPRARQEALQEQAQDQSRLADNVIRAAASLREVAAQEQDAAGARAMRQAAEALEQGSAAGHMRDAAAHLDAAHDARAAVAQQQAATALQQVSEALRDGLERQKSNVARLQRALIDLRALVMRLLERQQTLVEQLEGTALAAEAGAQAERIRRGMLAAAQRASRSGEEDTGITFTLQAAARVNESVTGALYARPPARAVALEAAQEAVTALLRAIDLLDDARSRLEDMEQRKATDGLVARLREWATAQATLITRTDEALDSGPLDRRARFTARQLGQAQRDLAAAVRQGATDSPLLESSLVTARALDQVATIAQDAADVLLDGRMTVNVSSGQTRVLDMLEAMAAAFADPSAGTGGQFAGAGGAGGADGGASSRAGDQNVRLPAVAELQVLRNWQAQLLEECGPDAGTHSSEMLDRLASEQASLASLGAALVEAMGPPAPRVEIRDAPPGMRIPPTDYPPAPPVEPLPSLDALLGLESNGVDTPMPPVPDDALQAMTARLRQSAVALSAHELTQSRRLQQDALDRIDALLEQARQQPAQGAQSPATATSSQQAAATAEESGQGTGAEATGARAGQGDQQLRVVQPGGALAHEGRSWGALPPRLRRLLEQGRRDVRSEIHAETTERYFRLLLEVDR